MEKKKNIKTRFMAGALALMLSGAHVPNGYAIQNENQYENQVVTLQTIEESLSKSGELDEEYAKYLKDNGIEVVDGNIKVETVEQFKIVKDYYYKYYEENNLFDKSYEYSNLTSTEKNDMISASIFFINYEELSDDLKIQLLEQEVVKLESSWLTADLEKQLQEEGYSEDEIKNLTCVPFNDLCNFLFQSLWYNHFAILEGNTDLISLKNIFFNNELRTIESMFEEDLSYCAVAIKNEEYDKLNVVGDKYLGYLFDKGNTYQPDFFSLPMNDLTHFETLIFTLREIMIRNQYRFAGEFSEALDTIGKFENEINTVKEKALELTKK